MRLPFRLLCLALLVASLSACGSVRLSFDHERGYDFTALHSYAWTDLDDPSLRWVDPETRRSVRAQIDALLQARGYELADATTADFLVRYRQVLDRGVKDPGRVGGIGQLEAASRERNEGGLTIEIRDRRSGSVVWTGTAKSFITNPRDAETVMTSAVPDLLRQFPPH